MERPQLNSALCAKVDVEVKNDEAHIEHKKAHHKEQHFLITAKLPPLLRTNKSFDFCDQSVRF
jgi:hypothetical protein